MLFSSLFILCIICLSFLFSIFLTVYKFFLDYGQRSSFNIRYYITTLTLNMTLTRWVLVPRKGKKEIEAFWESERGVFRTYTEHGDVASPMPTLVDGFVAYSPAGMFLGSYIIVVYILGAIATIAVRLYLIYQLNIVAIYEFVKNPEDAETNFPHLTKDSRYWAFKWTWFYTIRVFITDTLTFIAFFIVPLLDFFFWEHYNIIQTWFPDALKVPSSKATWTIAYYMSEYFQAYNRFKFSVAYLAADRYRVYDYSDEEFNWLNTSQRLWGGISSYASCYINYVNFTLPISFGALTVFIIIITGRPRMKTQDIRSPNYYMMTPIFKLTGLPRDFEGYIDYRILQWVKYREWIQDRKIKRFQRMEWWLGEPIVNVHRLRHLTLKANKTEEEEYLLDEEWRRHYRQLDARDHINARYRLRKKKFQEEMRERKRKRKEIQRSAYEKLINGKKLTYKQYMHQIRMDMEKSWEYEKSTVSWSNLLPSNEEKVLFRKYLNSLKSEDNPWIYRNARFVWNFFERRYEDFEDYYYIYWEYTSYIGNKFFPNFRRSVRLYLKKLKFIVSQRGRIKLQRFYLLYLKPSVYYVWCRFIKQPFKRMRLFYFINIEYPLKKRFITVETKFKVCIMSDFNKFKVYLIKNPDKWHVKAIIITIKGVYDFLLSCIVLVDFFMFEPLRLLYKYFYKPIYNFINWYLSKRIWNRAGWQKRWATKIKREELLSKRKYQHHLAFDRFIRKLGWFKKLLPVNMLRRLYVNFYSEPERDDEQVYNERSRQLVRNRSRRKFLLLHHKTIGPKMRRKYKYLYYFWKRRAEIGEERETARRAADLGKTKAQIEEIIKKRRALKKYQSTLKQSKNKKPENDSIRRSDWWF